MINHNEKIKELISAYIDGFVTEEERKQVEDLIINSKEWQEYYKELTQLSSVLKDWSDEDVSADMANKIQKTLLDDKLREANVMNRKSMLTLGGGVFVTAAICLIIGAVYLRTYSEKNIQQHVQTAAYEPYYLTGEARMKQAADDIGDQYSAPGQTAGYRESKPDRPTYDENLRETAQKRLEGYDLASVYKNEPALQESGRAIESRDKEGQSVSRTAALDSSLGEGKRQAEYDLAKVYEKPTVADQLGQVSGTGGKLSAAKDARRDRASGGFQASSYGTVSSGISAPAESKEESEVSNVEFWGGGQSSSHNKKAPVVAVTSDQVARKSKLNYGYENYPASSPAVNEKTGYGSQRGFYDADDSGYIGNDRAMSYPEEEYYVDRLIYQEPERTIYPYPQPRPNTEEYDPIYENPFFSAANMPLSTFSIDVDTASYSNIRRFVEQGQLPPADAVRIEEMINYFDYNFEKPKWGEPFSVTTKGGVCPWNNAHYLVMIGLQGNVPAENKIPPSNLVFLIDVSGSMNQSNKLPLLKQSLKMMVNQLQPNQKVAIVTYSGSARLHLDSTSGAYKERIHAAIDNLSAGGSTAGEAGIKLAYRVAKDHFIRNGNNRVILASDGDFNVGMQNDYDLVELIKERAKDGVFLSILGFGTGNYKDSKMEKIADNGNGNYYYIDTLDEGRKVLVDELGSTLFTIAKDVKIQVEFNPQYVQAYRLIGYENRILNKEDFNNDRVDAGEIGAGHTVTALYEIIPNGVARPMDPGKGVDSLKYQKQNLFTNNEVMTVKLRFKAPKSDHSRLIKGVVRTNELNSYISGDLQFAGAVAEFGLLLRNSRFKGNANYDHVIAQARQSRGVDSDRHRAEFVNLVEQVKQLDYRYHGYPQPQPYSEGYPYPVYDQYQTEQTPPIRFK
ncbi:MAG: von Willebrand factor type A domain-containing protein [Candidatus Omnitrophota bacterium]